MKWVMILRGKPSLPGLIPPFSKEKESKPEWCICFCKNHSSQHPHDPDRAAGRGGGGVGGSRVTYANSPGFLVLEQQILTLSLVPSGPCLPDLLR